MSRQRSGISCRLLAFVFLVGTAINCIEGPLEPIAPSMDAVLVLSLADTIQVLGDAIKDPPLPFRPITRNSDGTISYSTTESFPPFGPDSIYMIPQSLSDSVEVGTFKVDSLKAIGTTIQASTLNLTPGTYPGLPIEAGAVLPPISSDVSAQLDYIHIVAGTLYLRVVNSMPVPIVLRNGLVLRNNATSPVDRSVIASFLVGDTLAANSTISKSVDLADRRIRGSIMSDSISVSVPPVLSQFTVGPSAGLAIDLSTAQLQCDTALAIIPEQAVFSVDDSTFVLDDSLVVQTASFKSGVFRLTVDNDMDVSVGMYVKLNNFVNAQTRIPFQIDTVLAKKATHQLSLYLKDWELSATPAMTGTRLTFSVGFRTINSGGQKATITSTDYVSSHLLAGNPVTLKSATGKIKPVTFNVKWSQATGFNSGEFGQKFSGKPFPDSTRFELRFPIVGANIPIEYDLSFRAKNTARNIVHTLMMPATTSGSRRIYPVPSQVPTIVFDKWSGLDSLFNKFLPDLPDSISVTGQIVLNPPDEFAKSTLYTIADKVKITPSLTVKIPGRFSLADGMFKSSFKLRENTDSTLMSVDVSRALRSAQIGLDVTNSIPLQLGVRLGFIGKDPATGVRDTLLRLIPSSLVQAAPVDAAGYSTGARTSTITIGLNAAEIQRMNFADSLVVQINLMTAGGGSTPVSVRTTDAVRIRAGAKVVYTVNKPK